MVSIKINLIVEGYSPRQSFTREEGLKKSIEIEGLLEPILVRKDGKAYVIIDGNMRFRAVCELDFQEVACIILDANEEKSFQLAYIKNTLRENFSPMEEAFHLRSVMDKYRYNVEDLVRLGYASHRSSLDNKLSLLSLPEEIQPEISNGNISPTVGYRIANLQNKDDQVKIAQDVINSGGMSVKKVENKIKSILDSRKNQDKEIQVDIPEGDIPGVFFKDSSDMSEFKDESVGLIVTSPAYWVQKEYEKDVSFQEHLDNLKKVFSECARVLCPGGRICINFVDIHTFGSRDGGIPEIKLMDYEYQEILGKYGIRLVDEIVWEKAPNWVNNPQCSYSEMSKQTEWRILRNVEKIYVFKKDGKRSVPYHIEFESRISKDEWKEWVNAVWKISSVQKQDGHPAQFPEELPRRLIKMYSFIGDVVVDPFGGTMTTVKVANELDRVGIGYEREKKYKSAIMKKLGIKEQNIHKPEPIVMAIDHLDDPIDHFQTAIEEILSEEQRSADDIMHIEVPVKDVITKDDIKIDWNNKKDPDPSGSSPNLQLKCADDYEPEVRFNNKLVRSLSNPQLLLSEHCSDISPLLNKIILGDCLDKLKKIPDNSVDAAVTDPPYGMDFMGKAWDKAVPSVDIWKEVYRTMKPGAFAFVMSIPRQDCQSRMITNLESAGFQVNFTPLYWAYAQGFPKAYNIAKGIEGKIKLGSASWSDWKKLPGKKGINDLGYAKLQDQQKYRATNYQGRERNLTVEYETEEAKKFDGAYAGFQSKPAVEVILVVMKPMDEKTYVDQALNNGKGITWLDDCRIPYGDIKDEDQVKKNFSGNSKYSVGLTWIQKKVITDNFRGEGRFPANLLVSDNVLDDGKTHAGGAFPAKRGKSDYFGLNEKESNHVGSIGDNGGFSRFFSLDAWREKTLPFLIVPKASKKEKNAGCEALPIRNKDSRSDVAKGSMKEKGLQPSRNFHPTVKPIELMSYLITMGSREGDVVLDPFTGSGTTCIAAKMLKRKFIGIELNEEYQQIAETRVNNATMKMAA
jgi:ParB/RepB/Spo0J family partition protein